MTLKTIIKNHVCRFNDGEQTCDCFVEGFTAGQASASHGDYGRRMFMNGHKEGVEKTIQDIKNIMNRCKTEMGLGRALANYITTLQDSIKSKEENI